MRSADVKKSYVAIAELADDGKTWCVSSPGRHVRRSRA
jgi:hypothetical protein